MHASKGKCGLGCATAQVFGRGARRLNWLRTKTKAERTTVVKPLQESDADDDEDKFKDAIRLLNFSGRAAPSSGSHTVSLAFLPEARAEDDSDEGERKETACK